MRRARRRQLGLAAAISVPGLLLCVAGLAFAGAPGLMFAALSSVGLGLAIEGAADRVGGRRSSHPRAAAADDRPARTP